MMHIKNVQFAGRELEVAIDGGRIIQVKDVGPARPEMPIVIPGMIDLHVHDRQPGGEHKEDLAHLFRAAMAGGVTTMVKMPNTTPPITTMAVLRQARELARSTPLKSRFWFGASPTNDAEIEQAFQEPDVVGLKIYTGSTTNNILVDDPADQERLMALCAKHDRPAAAHCVDDTVIAANCEQLGRKPTLSDHHLIRSVEAKLSATRQIIAIAEKVGCRVYFCHVSSVAVARLILAEQSRGFPFFIETCPHYLFLDSGRYQSPQAAFFKMNPALREPHEREALWWFFASGLIDTCASDHAPHTWGEKSVDDYSKVPSGVPGLQTSLPLLVDRVLAGALNWQQLILCTASQPAEIIGLGAKGRIVAGFDADLVLIDPQGKTVITNAAMHYKCGWTPFDGLTLRGKIVATMMAGKFHYDIR